jgi:bifunctional non-homologous end joining protein LigD
MKRYPNGAAGEFFFMKRTPPGAPEWLKTCEIKHSSGNVIQFPVVDDLAALLWVVNLGCIDLDPTPGAKLKQVLQPACAVHEALDALKIPSYPKTTGSRGRRNPRCACFLPSPCHRDCRLRRAACCWAYITMPDC